MSARAIIWSMLAHGGTILAHAGMIMQTFSPANKRVSCLSHATNIKHAHVLCFVLVSRVMASFMILYCPVRKELP